MQYSLLYRTPERNGVLEACRENGVTLVAYSPLCQGLLTGGCVGAVEWSGMAWVQTLCFWYPDAASAPCIARSAANSAASLFGPHPTHPTP